MAEMSPDHGVRSVVVDNSNADDTMAGAEVAEDETAAIPGSPLTEGAELAWSNEDPWADAPTMADGTTGQPLRSLLRWCIVITAVLATAVAATWLGLTFYHDESSPPSAAPTSAPKPPSQQRAAQQSPKAPAPPPSPNISSRSAPSAPSSAQQDAKFLELMNAYGLVPPNSDQEEVNAGRSVCTRLNEGEPYQEIVQNVLGGSADSAASSGNGNSMDRKQAETFVDTAINIYCPR